MLRINQIEIIISLRRKKIILSIIRRKVTMTQNLPPICIDQIT